MNKDAIIAALEVLGAEFKKSLGKDNLLALLSEELPFEDEQLRVAAQSRGMDPNLSRVDLVGALGFVVAEDADGNPMVQMAPPAPVEHEGEDVEVICITENVHLGDGRVMRLKDRMSVPRELAELMEAKEQVAIV